jgi:GTPase SAR1 family protein
MYKVLFLGDASVGKTTFINKCSTGEFIENYETTISPAITKVQINSNTYYCAEANNNVEKIVNNNIYFHDDFDSNFEDSVVLMYNTAEESSFANLDKWKQAYDYNYGGTVPAIVVGTNGDKVIDNFHSKVIVDNIEYDHVIVSSKTNYNLEKPFTVLNEKLNGLTFVN